MKVFNKDDKVYVLSFAVPTTDIFNKKFSLHKREGVFTCIKMEVVQKAGEKEITIDDFRYSTKAAIQPVPHPIWKHRKVMIVPLDKKALAMAIINDYIDKCIKERLAAVEPYVESLIKLSEVENHFADVEVLDRTL